MNKELVSYITEYGFELDWQHTDKLISAAANISLMKFYEGHREDPFKSLLLFGFQNKSYEMSESVFFCMLWHQNSCQFL